MEHIHHTQPDMVLLDLWLEQRGDSWTILHALRHDAATAQSPIIICTADRQAIEDEVARYADARCQVMTKPFEVDALLATVHTALQGDATVDSGEVGA